MSQFSHLCSPGFEKKRFDQMTCLEQVVYVYNAYVDLTLGKAAGRVRYGERWIDKHMGSIPQAQNLYVTLWNQCPEAQMHLPDLSEGSRVQRGCGYAGFCR